MLQFLFDVVQQKYPDLNFQALLMQNIRKLILSPWTEQEIDLLTVDKSLLLTKPRTITVNYLKTIATLDHSVGTQVKVKLSSNGLILPLSVHLEFYLFIYFFLKFFYFQKLIQSLSSKQVELQRLNNGKLLLEQRLDEVLKQKEREQAVSQDWLH